MDIVIKSGMITPILCGSAVLNMGVPQLMDLVVNGFPAPVERAPKKGIVPGADEEVQTPGRRSPGEEASLCGSGGDDQLEDPLGSSLRACFGP